MASAKLNAQNEIYQEMAQSDKEIAAQEKDLEKMFAGLNDELSQPLDENEKGSNIQKYLEKGSFKRILINKLSQIK